MGFSTNAIGTLLKINSLAVLEAFRTKSILGGINKTLIVLTPKTKNAVIFNYFCPIGLYNYAYKVAVKNLVNSFHGVLPDLISPNQEAFVEGRWITENTVVAQEIVHKIKKHWGK